MRRLGPSRVAAACLVALAIGEGGCAMIMQQPPKRNRAPGEVPVCSTGRGGVALDGILAALLGAGALVALANDEAGAALGVGAVAGVYTYSAVSGHRSADACDKAIGDYQLEVAARRPERAPARERGREREPAAAAAAVPAAPARPAGPPIDQAAPAEEEAPPPEEAVVAAPPPPAAPAPAPAESPAPPPAPRDWSDFWVEETR